MMIAYQNWGELPERRADMFESREPWIHGLLPTPTHDAEKEYLTRRVPHGRISHGTGRSTSYIIVILAVASRAIGLKMG